MNYTKVLNDSVLLKKTMVKKNILIVAGVISTLLGIVGAIPSFLNNNITPAILSTVLIVGGLVILAIGFGEL
ncbi:hypothetical protein ACFLZX_02945 [Nanoarchaeota archaeon]